jgi:hypothetical protein
MAKRMTKDEATKQARMGALLHGGTWYVVHVAATEYSYMEKSAYRQKMGRVSNQFTPESVAVGLEVHSVEDFGTQPQRIVDTHEIEYDDAFALAGNMQRVLTKHRLSGSMVAIENEDGESVCGFDLREETLTDGSKVHTLIFRTL